MQESEMKKIIAREEPDFGNSCQEETEGDFELVEILSLVVYGIIVWIIVIITVCSWYYF